MGRELAKQLTAQGCHVAICDVSAEHMAETQTLCRQAAPHGTRPHPVTSAIQNCPNGQAQA